MGICNGRTGWLTPVLGRALVDLLAHGDHPSSARKGRTNQFLPPFLLTFAQKLYEFQEHACIPPSRWVA